MNRNKKNDSDSQVFVIDIHSTENYSWQGTLEWVDGQKGEAFRSALELIRLMDSALNKGDNNNIK
ncbi:MAG: hypothetical protein PHC41_03725 [Lachnospiraceae bacterium]|nr:hypothetical protein [Lachnospiraceae bacterium]MDD3615317.1 hypothetical protein [Lachnospiraceae bacterium]